MNSIQKTETERIIANYFSETRHVPLEINIFERHDHLHISAIIFAEKLDLEQLTLLHNSLAGYLDQNLQSNFSLELSTPGIDRVFASPLEYTLFSGKPVKVISSDGAVFCGINRGINDNKLSLEINNSIKHINISSIKKTRLSPEISTRKEMR
ncbi:MAG: hypothetical protein A2096_05490 [Spirochaetes bacterium GWF1_41_5]|nr:MAG: hypothetical protein A2096_05490 [Spirochaetes bacterium GWF1_41_5]HBE01444.1 hypothetical protein [Spirochaetia bacterium]